VNKIIPLIFVLLLNFNRPGTAFPMPDIFSFPHESIVQSVLLGNPEQAILKQACNLFLSGFQPYDAAFLKRLYGIISNRRVCIVQNYVFNPSNLLDFPILVRIPIPITCSQKQVVNWKGVVSNAPFSLYASHVKVRLDSAATATVKIASVVSTEYHPIAGLVNRQLPPNKDISTITSGISIEIQNLRNLWERIQFFFGDYHHRSNYVQLPYILLNPFQPLECNEYTILAQAILRDKGLNPLYRYGILLDYAYSNNREIKSMHAWIRVLFDKQMFEIDPTSGKKLGLTSYSGSCPRNILFDDDECSDYTETFTDKFGVDVSQAVDQKSHIRVFEFTNPFIKSFECVEKLFYKSPAPTSLVKSQRNPECSPGHCQRPIGGIIGFYLGTFLRWW